MSGSKRIFLTVAFLIAVPWLANRIASAFLPAPLLQHLTDKAVANPPAFLAIGTSRMAADLNPGAFQNQLTILAVPFMDIEITDMIVRSHEDLLKKSGRVYLEYHPEMLIIGTLRHQPEVVQTLGQLRLSPWLSRWVLFDPSIWRLGAIFPFLTQVRLTPRQLLHSDTDHGSLEARLSMGIENGFQPRLQQSDEASLERTSKEIYRQIKKYERQETEERGLEQFRALDAHLREQGVDYCWLEMPKHPSLRRLQRKSIERVANALAPILSEKRCLSPERLSAAERELRFSDPNHLYVESSQRFSEAVLKR